MLLLQGSAAFASGAQAGVDQTWRDRFVLGDFAQTMRDPVRAAREGRVALDAAQRSGDLQAQLKAAASYFLAMDENTGDCAVVDPVINAAKSRRQEFAVELFDVAAAAYLSLSDQHCKSFLQPDELEALARQLGDPARMYFVLGARALATLKENRFNDAIQTLAEQPNYAISQPQVVFSLHNRAQAELAANPASNAARALLADALPRIVASQYPALYLSQQVLSFRMEFAARHDVAAFDHMKQALPGTLKGVLGACPSGFDLVTFARAKVTAGRPGEALALLDEARKFNSNCKKLVALRSRVALEACTALGTPDALARGQREIEQMDALLADTRSFGPQTVRAFKSRAASFWERFGRYEEALRALRESNKAGEELQRISSETARVELQEKLNVAAKDKENAELKAESELQAARQRGWMMAFGAAAVGVAATAVALAVAMRRGRRLVQVSAELALRNRELEQRSASRIRLLAAACHDLRQPAHALGMLAELGADAQRESSRFVAWLQSVRRSTASLGEMLDELMDLGRLDGGHYTPQLAVVSLAELLHDVMLHFGGLAKRKGLSLDVPPADGHVMSDGHLLRRILFNLVSNAIKYTDSGFVRVRLQYSGPTVCLTVQDSGSGIPPHRLEDVFRDRVRLDPAKAAEGLGIGLSIVRRAAELLGHKLNLSSSPGEGTTVALTLPLIAEAPLPEPVPAAGAVGGGRGVLALLEDDVEVRDAMAALLQRWGYTVHAAADVEGVLASLESNPLAPALVISDLHLGASDGLTEVARLRDVLQAPALPALLVTGDLDAAIASQAAQASVYVAHKPLAPRKLSALVAQLLQIPALDRGAEPAGSPAACVHDGGAVYGDGPLHRQAG
ncbi:ATP-binding protein [Pelomonas sp. P7]|uniref:histidine kinase n=1 Tax=Pelomonas caseinilytica TaxID=2906763 RepID=A0ABS8X6Q9_9BURK|nr:hybrid sensor histidine kinase/response regulator [Pelomonas sp. P7]MCE4536139.1 ATP-binding protein [Pelomonas sp. P7]